MPEAGRSAKPQEATLFLQAVFDMKAIPEEDVRVLSHWSWFTFKWMPKQQYCVRSQVLMYSITQGSGGPPSAGPDNSLGEENWMRRECYNSSYRPELLPYVGLDWTTAQGLSSFVSQGRKCIIGTALTTRTLHLYNYYAELLMVV